MRVVVQRVRSARVTVAGAMVGEIGPGLLAYVGITHDDGDVDVAYVTAKLTGLRVFDDDAGKLNRTLADVGGHLLVVSQFTLYGDCRRGRRPSFDAAAPAERGRQVFDDLVTALRTKGVRVETGQFQAHMIVASENDGPVTLLIDSAKAF